MRTVFYLVSEQIPPLQGKTALMHAVNAGGVDLSQLSILTSAVGKMSD